MVVLINMQNVEFIVIYYVLIVPYVYYHHFVTIIIKRSSNPYYFFFITFINITISKKNIFKKNPHEFYFSEYLLINTTNTITNMIHIQHFHALLECSVSLLDSTFNLAKLSSVNCVDLPATY